MKIMELPLIKRMFCMKAVWACLILSLFTPTVFAKTLYITDVLYVTIRDSYMEGSNSIKALKSGTVLDEIGEEQEGYAFVRTEDGIEGWIKAKYLVDEPVAKLQLSKIETRLKKLDEENVALKEKYSVARKKQKEAEKERKRLESQSQNLTNENKRLKKLSAKPLELSQENEKLKADYQTLETEALGLRQENESFKSNSGRDWFLVGAGVLLIGLIIGLVIPRMRLGKKNEWA